MCRQLSKLDKTLDNNSINVINIRFNWRKQLEIGLKKKKRPKLSPVFQNWPRPTVVKSTFVITTHVLEPHPVRKRFEILS